MSSIIDGKKYLPTIGNFFKEKCEKAGLNQDYVAMELNIARSNIPKYEIGKDAVKSKFMDAKYMSFSAGTPMVETDYEIVEEQEFKQLIHAVLRFRDDELIRIELPYQSV